MIKSSQLFFYVFFFGTINLIGQTLPTDVPWNENETGYYTTKENNIVFVSTEWGKEKIILSSSDTGHIKIESFFFSKSKRKVLLFTESVKVWRYNTRGNYWVYDFDKKGFSEWIKPGIRAQLLNKKTKELVMDFVVEGDKNSIHILNAVSPAFTCSIPFAKYVVDNYIVRK